MAWNYPLTFDPSEPFCTYVVFPLSPKGGNGDPLILYSKRVLFLFVLAMTVTLGVYKRKTLVIHPVSAVTSTLEGKQEAGCKCLNLSLPISGLKKC